MYCHKCGKQINENSAFCNYCGAKMPTRVKLSSLQQESELKPNLIKDSQKEKNIAMENNSNHFDINPKLGTILTIIIDASIYVFFMILFTLLEFEVGYFILIILFFAMKYIHSSIYRMLTGQRWRGWHL